MNQKYWIAVASADHVAIGQEKGFMQVCHGKKRPLQQVKANDVVAYYSSVQTMGSKTPLQQFTALGMVLSDEVYQVEMAPGFSPYRKNVKWLTSQNCSIRDLLPVLSFSQNNAHWGYKMRFGIFAILQTDMMHIALAMGCMEQLKGLEQ
jgi:hypothetical protein